LYFFISLKKYIKNTPKFRRIPKKRRRGRKRFVNKWWLRIKKRYRFSVKKSVKFNKKERLKRFRKLIKINKKIAIIRLLRIFQLKKGVRGQLKFRTFLTKIFKLGRKYKLKRFIIIKRVPRLRRFFKGKKFIKLKSGNKLIKVLRKLTLKKKRLNATKSSKKHTELKIKEFYAGLFSNNINLKSVKLRVVKSMVRVVKLKLNNVYKSPNTKKK